MIGGLGSAVAEIMVINSTYPSKFKMFGFPDTFARVTGTREYLNEYYGLDAKSIAEAIKKYVGA